MTEWILRRLRRRRLAGRAPAADRLEPRHPALRGRPGAPAGGRHARGERTRSASRRASRGLDSWYDAASFTPLRRHARASAGARATSPGRTRSTSTSRSTTWCAAHRGWRWPRSATVGPMADSTSRAAMRPVTELTRENGDDRRLGAGDGLLKAFFSHEGRVVAHLEPERAGDPGRPRPRLLHAGRRQGRRHHHHPHLGRRWRQRRDRGDLGAALSPRPGHGRDACCARPSPSAGAAASSRSSCA